MPVDPIGMDPYGISHARLVELTGCHPDTVRRWKRQRRIPRPWAVIVRLRLECALGALAAVWDGWTLRGEWLVSPEGSRFRPGQVRAIPYQCARISALERERRQVPVDVVEREQRDAPGARQKRRG